MPVTGWKAPGTAASVDRNGRALWTNPNNAKTDDANYAQCVVGLVNYSDWLRLTNFDFSEIPEGSAIDGIEVAYKKQAETANTISDSAIYLRKGSGQVGDNKASATFWPQVPGIWFAGYGGAADTWNAGLLDSDVRVATFGVDLSAHNKDFLVKYARIYYCQIRIYYTPLPTVETDPCSDIGSTSFDANGDITDAGGDDITKRGFHYSEFFDNFEWGIDTDPLTDSGGAITWGISAPGASKAEIDTAQHYTGTRSARLYRDGANTAAAYFSQTAIASDQVLYACLMKDETSNIVFYHGNGTKLINIYYMTDESLEYRDDGGWHETGATISVGEWTVLMIKNVNWAAGTYDIYLDGVLIQTGAVMRINAAYANVVRVDNQAGTSEIWIDDIAVWDVEDEDGSWGTGEYSLEITGLDSPATYYVQAFAENSAGFGYGVVVTCRTIIAKVLSDTVAISDSIVKAVGLNKSDSAAISDAIVKSVGLFKADTLAIADAILKAVSLGKADTVTIADSVAKLVSLVKADTVTIADSIRKAISIVKADAMTITDVLTHIGLGKFINLFDTVTITDSLVGVLRVKTYLKQEIDRMGIKGLDAARMSVKKMGIDQMSIKRFDIAQMQAKGIDIARTQTKRIGAAKTALYRWITRRWTA